MGLSQAKRKVKISHDPNNTSWSKNTSSFGHKILTSQGWTPGEYLGPQDAAHAEFHSAANASHIRVVLKDDNLGLGAKKGSGQGPGECTGLDAFTSLLGRLNADDQEEYVQEEKKRQDLKRAIYTEKKWGSMRFVKGGFLVGDKVVEIAEAEAKRVQDLEAGSDSANASKGEDSSNEESTDEETAMKKKAKKDKKSRKHAPDAETKSTKEKSKNEKKRKHKEEADSDTTEETEAERKIRKKAKKERKRKAEEEASVSSSKRRKEEKGSISSKKTKKRQKSESTPDESTTEKLSRNHKDKKSKKSSEDTTLEITEKEVQIPRRLGLGILQGRHAVRARNIAQKRMASMDAASLNQIFMIKG